MRDECRCYAKFIKYAPTLTVSDVLSLLLGDDTVTVLLRLDRFLINQLSLIHYIKRSTLFGT